jgi:hypothetical protein
MRKESGTVRGLSIQNIAYRSSADISVAAVGVYREVEGRGMFYVTTSKYIRTLSISPVLSGNRK